LSEAFENKCDFIKWLKAFNNVIKMAPFDLSECVLLDFSFEIKAEEFDTSPKLNGTL
jgi:hypothetical protein